MGTASRATSFMNGMPGLDGNHRLRSLKTQQQLIEAFLSLVAAGATNPTPVQIAEQAGCGAQAIREHFPSLAALRIAATDFAFAQAAALAPADDLDGDRKTRIRSQVEMRALNCERAVTLWRLLRAAQQESEELRHRLSLARGRVRARLQLMYGPELATLSMHERNRLLFALEALTDPDKWAQMRDSGMSFAEACESWVSTIDRMLPPTPGDGGGG
jgi:hypothetical protein